jgi:hypothetical protein
VQRLDREGKLSADQKRWTNAIAQEQAKLPR